jgi:hypothetical protein
MSHFRLVRPQRARQKGFTYSIGCKLSFRPSVPVLLIFEDLSRTSLMFLAINFRQDLLDVTNTPANKWRFHSMEDTKVLH